MFSGLFPFKGEDGIQHTEHAEVTLDLHDPRHKGVLESSLARDDLIELFFCYLTANSLIASFFEGS